MVVDRLLRSVESPSCIRLKQTFDRAPPMFLVSICMAEQVASFVMYIVLIIF
jgi:hypothetical protein